MEKIVMEFVCSTCKKVFKTRFSLKRHIKNIHENNTDKPTLATCPVCKKQFNNSYNIRRHIAKFHKNEDVQNLLPSPKKRENFKYNCDMCEKNFNIIHNLKHHQRKVHGLETGKATLKKCPICPDNYSNNKRNMLIHFKEKHDITILSKNLSFSSYDEFKKWKAKYENETFSNFSMDRKTENQISYTCHRSGCYKSKGKGIRRLKSQGSVRINGFCPSSITVNITSEKIYKTNVIETHVGHDRDIEHLHISFQERKDLAGKIASQIPFDVILDEIRDAGSGTNLQRIHLLAKKDLHNIKYKFNLNSSSTQHSNDASNLESWVNQMRELCVLFYKAQDSLSEDHPELKLEDFLLIIMNNSQGDMLQKFGANCVCLDSTNESNNYNFELNTLLVIDDMNRGFPCAFLISNRSDEVVFKIFFSHIKSRAGTISPKVFMADVMESYFNSWLAVMGEPELRLYSIWHVDDEWRKNLTKIRTREKQVTVYKQLQVILQETDVAAFHMMIEQFYKKVKNDIDTTDFSQYFKDHYMTNCTHWAYCYRLLGGLNTNMHLEGIHKTIKYVYLHGQNTKRLDKAIYALMKFVRDKLFDRIIMLNKEKITSKLKDIQSRHKASNGENTNLVVEKENGWNVLSFSKSKFKDKKVKESYHVEELIENTCDCRVRCSDCSTCIHRYSCTCLDSSIKWNMCKHIHLVCKYRDENHHRHPLPTIVQNHQVDSDEDMNDDLCIDFCNENDESEIIYTELDQVNVPLCEDLEKEKELLSNYIHKKIQSIDSPSKLEVIKKCFASISPTFKAIDSIKSASFLLLDQIPAPQIYSDSYYMNCSLNDLSMCRSQKVNEELSKNCNRVL